MPRHRRRARRGVAAPRRPGLARRCARRRGDRGDRRVRRLPEGRARFGAGHAARRRRAAGDRAASLRSRSARPAPPAGGASARPSVAEPVLVLERLRLPLPGRRAPWLSPASTLEIAAGEFVVLAGRSGSGKSTLLRAACGLVPHFHGGEIAGRRPRRSAAPPASAGPAELAEFGRLRRPGARDAGRLDDGPRRARAAAGAARQATRSRPPGRSRRPRSRSRSSRCSSGRRTRSRAASCSASRSERHWSPARRCSSSTSRPRSSTRSPATS